MHIKVRMLGVLRVAGGTREITLDIPNGSTVGTAINELIAEDQALKTILWDLKVNSPSPNALIMVNGVEIRNLQGKDTLLQPDQELVLLSIVHGG